MSQNFSQHSQPVPPAGEEADFAAFVALDWADQKHVWALQVSGSGTREQGEIESTPEAVDAWVQSLFQRFGSRPIAVCLEQSRGALVYLLMKYPRLVLYPIQTATAGRFRTALYPSGTKNDPLDAELLLELLVHHRRQLRAWKPDTVETRTLQLLVEQRRHLVDQRTAESNRLTQALKLYFPQTLRWFDDIASPLAGAFLQRWPSLQAARKARRQTLQNFFHQHNCRRADLIQQRIEEIGQAMPATDDAAILRAHLLLVEHLIRSIALLRESIAKLDREIRTVVQSHPDFLVFDSLPGAGEAMVPRLIAAFGTQRERFSSASDVQTFSGIAPVTVRSGKSVWIHFRRACPKFLRQTFHEWAGHSIGFCHWAHAYYQQQRNKGADHHPAVRSLAGKWIRIVYRCWINRTPYDEQIYLAALRRRGFPLALAAALAAGKG